MTITGLRLHHRQPWDLPVVIRLELVQLWMRGVSRQFPTLLLAAAHRAELGALLRGPSMGHRHPGRERTGRVRADVGAAAGTRLPLTDRELWAAPTAQC